MLRLWAQDTIWVQHILVHGAKHTWAPSSPVTNLSGHFWQVTSLTGASVSPSLVG